MFQSAAFPRRLAGLLAIGLLASGARPAHAAWPHDPSLNVPVCTATYFQLDPKAVSDGAGGVIITWTDHRSGFESDIYAQRVSAAGFPLWAANGVPICVFSESQDEPQIVSDGAGGAVISWRDGRSASTYDVYAQRVNASGAVLWTANGVGVCVQPGEQLSSRIASDGAGGAILTWQDARTGIFDIYAQRVNGMGAVMWGAPGVGVCVTGGHQMNPALAPDGAGGVIIAWQDPRSVNNDIYAQRLNATGVAQWDPNGLLVCYADYDQLSPQVLSDNAGGAFVAWTDYRNGNVTTDIFAQRISSSGQGYWYPQGSLICNASGDQLRLALASDGAGGMLIAWDDFRNGFDFDVYAQRVGPSGLVAWSLNGAVVSAAQANQQSPTLVSDGAGGAIISWNDGRTIFNYDIYAQRLNSFGNGQWTFNGIPICVAGFNQHLPVTVTDGAGGAIVTWYDFRLGTSTPHIYAQRIDRFGPLGTPEPSIASVRDVPNDQGGKFKVAWNASYLDAPLDLQIAAYWIWRSVPPNLATAALARGARLLGDEPPVEGLRGQFAVTRTAASVIYWEYVGSQVATGDPGYSATISTTSDSVEGSNPVTMVRVQARGIGTGVFWNSAADSGYSVDNLAPAAPAPFTGAYAAGATHLHWGVSHESDLAGYRLYRGSSAEFVPGPGTLVSAQPDTGHVDAGPAGGWYKLTAVDTHGNESPVALLSPAGTTDVAEAPTLSLAFAGPAPNPVKAEGTVFRFALPAAGRVSLRLFDQQGRFVRELVGGEMPAGSHLARWDARDAAGRAVESGVYFGRLEAMGRRLNVRLAVIR